MKNQFKQNKLDLNNIASLNSTRSVSGFNTIPTSFDMVSYLRDMSLNFDTLSIFGNGGSSAGFTEFAAIFYRQFVNFVSSN